MKEKLCFVIGALGAWIAGLFGGWNSAMTTLLLFMVADYLTGLIVAGVFKSSPKTTTGALQSKAGLMGVPILAHISGAENGVYSVQFTHNGIAAQNDIEGIFYGQIRGAYG